MSQLHFRAVRASLLGALAMAALLFLPAGTIYYWQGWVFMLVFAASSSAITMYLAIHDPALLERRMSAGPIAEKEASQKIITVLVVLGFLSLLVFASLDYRFGWSTVPAYVSIVGNSLVALGFLFFFFVMRENSYAASTIQVAEDQKVISTGPYAYVRHPMYAGALVLLIGMSLALGSWWGLAALLFLIPVLIWRLLDEERFLRKNLPGYTEYAGRVRYRIVPYVW